MLNRCWRKLAVTTVCLLGSALAIQAAGFESNLDKSFPVKPGGKLVLDADQGSCEIKTMEGGTSVEIHVKREVKQGTKADADELFAKHEVTFQHEGTVVSV